MQRLAIVACCVSLIATPSHAGRYYFHKAHVDRTTYQADQEECQRLTGGVRKRRPESAPYVPPNPDLTVAQNAAAAGIAAFFMGMMGSAAKRRTINAIERTCMADKGYARYEVDEAIAERLERVEDPEERLNRYLALASAAQPTGRKLVE